MSTSSLWRHRGEIQVRLGRSMQSLCYNGENIMDRLHHRVFKERHITCWTQQRHYGLHQTAHPRDKQYSCVTLTTNLDFRHVNQCSATNATDSLRLSRRCLSFLATKVNNGCSASGGDKGAMIFQRLPCDFKSSKFLFGMWKGYISAIW